MGARDAVVVPGMLHSEPSLASALDAVHAGGARRIVVVVLAPQYSPIILAGYERAVAAGQPRTPTSTCTSRAPGT